MEVKNKLAIFDIDGTLTKSVSVHQEAFQKALEAFGFEDFDTNWSNYTHHTDSYIFKTILGSQFNRNVSPGDIARFEDILHNNIFALTDKSRIEEIHGARSFLNTLSLVGYDIVFATGSLYKPALLKLDQCGITCDVNLVITANSLISRDHIVQEAITKAKQYYSRSSYEHIVSFGDGLWDYETAKRLNIEFIGIGNEKLIEYGVTSFFSNFNDPALYDHLDIKQPLFPDFPIKGSGAISEEFIKRGILTFKAAAEWVKLLPYGRNKDKSNLAAVFADNCGTCSTKHALLKKLAIENNCNDLQLMVGLFRMNKANMPEVSGTLEKYKLSYIPEAHNYLKYNNRILDVTKENFLSPGFVGYLIEEVEIMPHQIAEFKVEYHKKYLASWLAAREEIKLSLDELWAVRESCIQDLTN